MKTAKSTGQLRPQFLLLVLSVISFCQSLIAETPAPAVLNLASRTNSNTAVLTITDPANHVWIVQRSYDLQKWSEVGAWKVYNGDFHGLFTLDSARSGFFRAWFDPARDNVSATICSALHLPPTLFNYAAPPLPPFFFQPPIVGQDNMPATNITTDIGATLGRVLFYDKRLSTNQTVSCSSCHQREHGFADPRRFSVGFDGSVGGRNAMSLSHARWYQRKHFFWDERANTLEDQVLLPIQNPIEMGMTLDALTNRLAAEPFYTNLFAVAFGSPGIDTNRISRALAQFVRSIISVQSKYDTGVSNGVANFTPQENLGGQIFFGQVGN